MSKKNSTPLEEINHLSQHYEEKVRPCIDLVDSLRSLGVEQDLALPAIAVIGDQSSGKSSVLEALSGVALPRGTGIVTRCPLVLKLKRVKNGTQWYGMLSYQNHIKVELKNPAEVEDAVTKAQNALAGEGKDISHEMINLEIHSTSVPDLTLIDLPGIARVATGNQSQDIEEQIKRLIETFIKKQETINLVVVPANVDIATTEALKMAKTVDPHGQRTLGILTKPDLVDKGAEEIVVNTLNNLVIPLKKGYMVVKCRGQKDINDKMSLTKALDREKKFFENHTHLRACLDEGKATIPHLSERLTNELVSHIKRSLPQLEKQIKEKLEKASTDLRRLGDGVPQDETERANFLIEKINSFNQVLTDMVRAEEYVGDSQTRVFTNIRILFSKWKTELDNKAIQLEEYLRDEVEDSNTHRGKELPGFVNYRTFETIVRRHVEDLEEPAMNLLRATTVTSNHHFSACVSCTNSAIIISKALCCEDCCPENAECIVEYSNVCHFHMEEVPSLQKSSLTSGLHQPSMAKSVCPDGTTYDGYYRQDPRHGPLRPVATFASEMKTVSQAFVILVGKALEE
ncbi:interferon-induced GTP-binding protein Mx-like isoform X2 [Alosa alosa]|uniref:interferon-induced GTP-binding protein Mx-like isoform X2 n=1 Tax=Alosa alosa TaxID=278164 RepID=UPI00201540F4|nr:interferon-induced GTP-binding protein Mx-like isoform X2 [Alosa alosa]